MLAAALLTVISFHNLFVGTMLCFLVSAAPAGLLAISLAVSAAGSMVIVNTVVLVKARFGLGEIEVAWRWRMAPSREPATQSENLCRCGHLSFDRPVRLSELSGSHGNAD